MAPHIPAAVRYNNPGAMWGKGNALATQWGSTHYVMLSDGLGQGNNIAVFPDKVHGAAAQFGLWRKRYTNMTLRAAILKWSGGNWSAPYAKYIEEHTGIGVSEMVTMDLLASDRGWKLMKYQASWEAGLANTGYPMSDAEWKQAQHMVFTQATTDKVKKVIIGVSAGGGVSGAASQALSSGVPEIIVYSIIGLAVAGIIYWLYRSIRNV